MNSFHSLARLPAKTPKRRLTLLILLALSTPNLAQAQSDRDSANERPHILLIMVDDLGKEWISCYGAEGIETPNIDRLAAGGMRFENAYCMPQCTPTRVTLLTGQYPFRHGWVNHWDVPRWGGGCSFDPELNPSVANLLKDNGYRTAVAGKWQIDDFRQEPNALVDAGFEEYCMWTGFEAGNPASGKRYWDPYIYTDQNSETRRGAFGPDVFTEFLIDFMRRNKDQPMFLYFPMVLTHGPLVHTPAEPNADSKMEKHRAMVRYTDQLLGRLVDALHRLRIRENTIIIWTTDNGTSRGITGMVNGRDMVGGKSLTTENGICVPFIVNGPGKVPEAVVSDALVDFTDLLPTLVDLAGGELPDAHAIDGRSFKDLILGRAADSQRGWIMSMGGRNEARLTDKGVENKFWFRDRVIRDKRFKLYIDEHRKPTKLVELASDPSEENNLINSDRQDVQAALAALRGVAKTMPERDADPVYRPLPQQPWFRQPNTKSTVWKTGYPGNR